MTKSQEKGLRAKEDWEGKESSWPPGGSGETQGHELPPHLSSVIKAAGVRMTALTSYFFLLYQRELVGQRGSWEDWGSGRRIGNFFFLS